MPQATNITMTQLVAEIYIQLAKTYLETSDMRNIEM